MSAKPKTSKTSHVMGLLRKNTPEPPTDTQVTTPDSAPAESAPSKPAPTKNPIITSLNEDASVAQEIKGALELELELMEHPPVKAPAVPEIPAPPEPITIPEEPEEISVFPEVEPEPEASEVDLALSELMGQLAEAEAEIAANQPQHTAPPAGSEMDRALSELLEQLAEVEAETSSQKQESVGTPVKPPVPPTQIPMDSTPEIPIPAKAAQPTAAPAVPAPASAPAPVPAPVPAANPNPVVPAPAENMPPVPETGYHNVIQALVEDSTVKYMKMFNLCLCPRCQADVKALALNNLPSKYVVLEPGESVPRMTMYERQYGGSVTAQILRACNIVAASPHHNKD